MNINIINKHNYLGEHKGEANILLSATVDDVFSITFEDEQNGTKSSWEMTMYRDDAEKVARKFAEMLGIIPIERKGEWIKHIDDLFPEESTEECPFCHEEQLIRLGNDDNYCPNCGAELIERKDKE